MYVCKVIQIIICLGKSVYFVMCLIYIYENEKNKNRKDEKKIKRR